MEKEFVRVRSMRDVIISAAMTVIGIVLIILPTSVSVNIFGTCLAVPGVLMLLFLKTDYRDTETGLRFRRVIKYYPASSKDEIMAALKSDLSKVAWNEKGTADGLMRTFMSDMAATRCSSEFLNSFRITMSHAATGSNMMSHRSLK